MEVFLILSVLFIAANSIFWPFVLYRQLESSLKEKPEPQPVVSIPPVIQPSNDSEELKSISESLQVLVQAEQKRIDEAEFMRRRRIEGRKIAAGSRNQKQGRVPERVLTSGFIPGSSGCIAPGKLPSRETIDVEYNTRLES